MTSPTSESGPLAPAAVRDKPLNIMPGRNARYTVVVWCYLFGQLRIQVWDKEAREQQHRDWGGCRRELCTYDIGTCVQVSMALTLMRNPVVGAALFEFPWNHEGVGGRIRLDDPPPTDGPLPADLPSV